MAGCLFHIPTPTKGVLPHTGPLGFSPPKGNTGSFAAAGICPRGAATVKSEGARASGAFPGHELGVCQSAEAHPRLGPPGPQMQLGAPVVEMLTVRGEISWLAWWYPHGKNS